MSMKRPSLIIVFVFFSLIFSSSVFGQPTKKIFKIGAVLHLTGDLAMVSAAFREGIELAVEKANAASQEFEIKLSVEDGQNNPKVSNTAVQKLINLDRVNALILSSHIDAMSSGPLIEKAHLPAIVLWDSNPEIDAIGEYTFAIGPWTPSAGEEVARFSRESLHAQTAVIVTNSDSWSEAVGDYFKKDFVKRGGKILDTMLLNTTETDFRSIVSRIKAAAPDFVYSPLVFNLVPFYSQLRQQKLSSAIISSDIIADEHIQKAPAVFEGIYQTGLTDPSSPEYQKLALLYKAKLHHDITLPWFVAVGYDSVGLFQTSLAQGSIGSEDVKNALYKIKNYKGASCELSINERGSSPQYERMFLLKGGKFVPVN